MLPGRVLISAGTSWSVNMETTTGVVRMMIEKEEEDAGDKHRRVDGQYHASHEYFLSVF